MRLRSAARDYAASMRATHRWSDLTHSKNLYILEAFVAHVGPDTAVKAVKPRHIESWAATQRCQASTLNARYSKIKGMFGWLLLHGHIRSDPCLYQPPKRPRSIPRELDEQQIAKLLLSIPDTRGEVMVLLEVNECLRCCEIQRLELGDIDFQTGTVFVTGKGGHPRFVPLHPSTLDAIHRYLGQYPARSGPLIRSYHDGSAISTHRIGFLVAGWMRDAGIKQRPHDGVSGHALRHTGAGAILDNGGDVRDVMEALGHAHASTSSIYLKRRIATSRLRKVMGRDYGTGPSPVP